MKSVWVFIIGLAIGVLFYDTMEDLCAHKIVTKDECVSVKTRIGEEI